MVGQAILLWLQGVLIGISGVLPGVSGGVLCIAFGIYKPFMEVLASPIQGVKKHFRLLLLVGSGAAVGFFLLIHAVEAVMTGYQAIATCVFAGMILGTLPSLWRAAGREPRTTASFLAFFFTFVLVFSLLTYLRYSSGVHVTPHFGWYLFAGALWAVSIVLPGISSAAILLFLGLFTPILQAAKEIDFSVLLPLAIGGGTTLLLAAKLINRLYERYFSVMSHLILGIVAATTLPLIPLRYAGIADFGRSLSAIVLGAALSLLFDHIGRAVSRAA